MKDKETKEMFDDLLMEVMGSYHDFMMNKISLNKHKAVEQKVGDFIKGVEQEAERRGARKELEKLKLILNDCVVYINDSGEIDKGVIGSVNRTIDAELKLLEEENGKQNER